MKEFDKGFPVASCGTGVAISFVNVVRHMLAVLILRGFESLSGLGTAFTQQ